MNTRKTLQPHFAHCPAITLFALADTRNAHVVTYEFDAAITVGIQFADAHRSRADVIEHHTRNIETRNVAVEQHHRQTRIDDTAHCIRSARASGDDKAIDALVGQDREHALQFVGLFVGTCTKHRIAGRVGDILDVTDYI